MSKALNIIGMVGCFLAGVGGAIAMAWWFKFNVTHNPPASITFVVIEALWVIGWARAITYFQFKLFGVE